jgi:hypothetical protein
MTFLACAPADESTPTISQAVGSFAAVAEGAANLGLHRMVDDTVDSVLTEAKFFNGLAVTGSLVIEKISEVKPLTGVYIDPNGELEDALTAIAERYESYLARMTSKKSAIDRDGRLHESHCDMLHSAYDELLGDIARFIDVTHSILACIARHDIAASPRDTRVFATVHELRTELLDK